MAISVLNIEPKNINWNNRKFMEMYLNVDANLKNSRLVMYF